MKCVTQKIKDYHKFLNSSYPYLEPFMIDYNWDSGNSFLFDWIQINWEFLVENQIKEEGDVFIPFSLSRNCKMLNDNRSPNCAVCAVIHEERKDLRSGISLPSNRPLILECFLSKHNNELGFYPPFNMVYLKELTHKSEFLTHFEGLDFYINPIS